jgi:serine/threonine protein kinase
MPLPPATRLGPYEIVAPLGAGGMGEVYRARNARLKRDFAIKVLPEAVPQVIERRLDHRFQLLRGTRRGRIERHQTLHQTVAWSYDLLEPQEPSSIRESRQLWSSAHHLLYFLVRTQRSEEAFRIWRELGSRRGDAASPR